MQKDKLVTPERFGSWSHFLKDYEVVLSELYAQLMVKAYSPKGEYVFSSFRRTDFDKVKVIIVSQQPYSDVRDATGIAMEVPSNRRMPPSLMNFHKEIQRVYPEHKPTKSLQYLIDQGVLFLNAQMTIGKGSSHLTLWDEFFKKFFNDITNEKDLVIVTNGKIATNMVRKYANAQMYTDNPKSFRFPHTTTIVNTPHPVARDDSFIGCNFTEICNRELENLGLEKIRWQS